ncbi:UPF0481 protein [Canna indica]|uniref:UPF0481 protein n=1 Tax=Canna indica TaxID=4628 RepID=A0AAQ3KKL2_9LILI|nr:UPF0481 protein [Canna indica]
MDSKKSSSLFSTKIAPHFDEQYSWVHQLRHKFNENVEIAGDAIADVSIFRVPEALLQIKPEAFYPQLFALGPYHHHRAELRDTERYKISAAKRVQQDLKDVSFDQLIDHLIKIDHQLRAPYERYLNFTAETLAWMMAIDGCFLLEFFKNHNQRECKVQGYASPSTKYRIIRDVMMLENQIPFAALRKILEFQNSSTEAATKALNEFVQEFIIEVSPLEIMGKILDATKHSHLLELLYFVLVPKLEQEPAPQDMEIVIDKGENHIHDNGEQGNSEDIKTVCEIIYNYLSSINPEPIRYAKELLVSKPIKFLQQIPWTEAACKLPGLSAIAKTMEQIFPRPKAEDNESNAEGASLSNSSTHTPPLMEEITIPSVTELVNAGVKFVPTNEGIDGISFDCKTATFCLPVIRLDVATEVVLRNLVVYEASSPGMSSMVFTRYTEMMNGIVDAEEDAEILRENRIILSHLKSDKEVADVWNGMGKSVRLTKVPKLDRVIKEVGEYYRMRWVIRARRFVKKYVFGSWKTLTLLAALFLLSMNALQSFCSVYSCHNWSKFINTQK